MIRPYATLFRPAQPYSSGRFAPSTPSSAIPVIISRGKWPSTYASPMIGRTWSLTKDRTESRTARSSSDRSESTSHRSRGLFVAIPKDTAIVPPVPPTEFGQTGEGPRHGIYPYSGLASIPGPRGQSRLHHRICRSRCPGTYPDSPRLGSKCLAVVQRHPVLILPLVHHLVNEGVKHVVPWISLKMPQ